MSKENNGTPPRRCTSESQKKAIRRSYAIRAAKEKAVQTAAQQPCTCKQFPNKFPFWARLKIGKNRTTLVIDEEQVNNNQKHIVEDSFVHREATSQYHSGFEKISPNPDRTRAEPMYLKNPRKLPKKLFKPHNKILDMPEHLKERYDKNNHKNDK